ncbi:hypothetical protein ZHAS_00015951 [Anopheles sinensis]|uniref:Uncharacterized protein n=1 Tax=Anopheles sinensis TaxID=74873 RepID=A0A084WCF0_ANOSI|nr:hypothetical protein ZHAS_00015951 [Anopheles sinensis]
MPMECRTLPILRPIQGPAGIQKLCHPKPNIEDPGSDIEGAHYERHLGGMSHFVRSARGQCGVFLRARR